MRRLLLILILLAMLPWVWESGTVDAWQQKPASILAARKGAHDPGEFAGSETCAVCHADLATKFASNPHSELALMHDGKGVTCESCHGPGEAHVASGGDPTQILQLSRVSAKQIDTTCLSCHASAHPNFLRSDHGKAGVGCTNCHSIHGAVAAPPPASAAVLIKFSSPVASDPSPSAGGGASASAAGATPANPTVQVPIAKKKLSLGARMFGSLKPDAGTGDPVQWSASSIDMPGQNPNLLRASQPRLCYSCHTDIKPAFSQPFHHKVNEGLMQCTDCHDAHGTFEGNQLRTTADQNMICTKCHTETRGPFVFEHAAVKSEGCVGCHSPHGSQNARLLNVPNINQMCNQCHSPVAAGTIHGMGAGSAEVQSCISCHTMIHGSNINSALIR